MPEPSPDDVWHALLSQFSLYVQANAETLRKHFVAHEGKKEYAPPVYPQRYANSNYYIVRLTVSSIGNLATADFGAMAQEMSRLLEENVKDADIRKWLIPGTPGRFRMLHPL
ncbi:hypothetical protein DL93DRAFT_2073807 [Clavulina sp. PMI_390]|nr:hypothetical protein DL93DRAFT_2073807 [Clavulina sp. PMI_390]